MMSEEGPDTVILTILISAGLIKYGPAIAHRTAFANAASVSATEKVAISTLSKVSRTKNDALNVGIEVKYKDSSSTHFANKFFPILGARVGAVSTVGVKEGSTEGSDEGSWVGSGVGG